jgi:hypothetical protein
MEPRVPQSVIDSFNKLSQEQKEKYEFMAAYPEWLIERNREETLKGIDEIRKDFQKATEQIAEELSETSRRTAWRVALCSLMLGFTLGMFSSEIKQGILRITETLTSAILHEAAAPKTSVPELRSEGTEPKRISE